MLNENEKNFQYAVESGKYQLVTDLLNDGTIDPNALTDASSLVSWMPFVHTVYASYDKRLKMLSWSLSSLNKKDALPVKTTILHEAIALKEQKLIDAILACPKTDVNQRNERGYTPLHYAAILNRLDIVEKLLARGADPTMTCNDFTAYEFTRSASIKNILLPNSIKPWVKPDWSDKLSECLHALKNRKAKKFYIPAQFGIMTKMRAMRDNDEVIYGSGDGTCSGVASTSKFYFLSNKRDAQGNLIGKLKLDRILRDIGMLCTEDFLAKTTTVSSKSVSLDSQIEPKQEPTAMEYTAFMNSVELLQSIYAHPELHNLNQPLIYQEAQIAVFSLLMPQELIELGGISHFANKTCTLSAKDEQGQNEIVIYFRLLQEQFDLLTFPVVLYLGANKHAISACYDPILHEWTIVDINQVDNSSPLFTTRDSTEAATKVYSELKQGSDLDCHGYSKPYLILETRFYTAKLYESSLLQCMDNLTKEKRFQSIYQPTTEKMAVKSNQGHSWWVTACLNGDVDTARMLSKKLKIDDSQREFGLRLAETWRAKAEEYENYYTYPEKFVGYFHRTALIELAFELNKKNDIRFKFIVAVLTRAPLGLDERADENNLHQAILELYSQWLYQGLDITNFLSNSDMQLIINHLTKQPMFTQNLNMILQQDCELITDMKKAIHFYERTLIDEDIVQFLNNCLITASKLAIQNAQNNIKTGVIDTAIEQTIESLKSTESVAQEKYRALWNNRFFVEKENTDKVDSSQEKNHTIMRNNESK